jgi:hypothetical protein
MANDLRRNVVRIEAKENGFGFIVGEKSGLLYVVTAYHVVVDPDKVETVVTSKVKVEFFDRRGVKFDADLLGTHDADRDLAVLTVRAPQGVEWTRQCLAAPEKQKRGTPVWFVGRDQEWKPPVIPGRVVQEPSTDWTIDLEGLQVKRGSSGGPVISDTGIIGMIETDSEVGTHALSVDFIQKSIEKWNHPWQLQPVKIIDSPPPPPPQTDLDAINAMLDLYSDSYNRRDAGALWRIWPNPPAQTKQAIEGYFRNARSIVRRVSDRRIDVRSVSATVRGQCLDDFTPKNGSPMKSNDPIILELAKNKGDWFIVSVK